MRIARFRGSPGFEPILNLRYATAPASSAGTPVPAKASRALYSIVLFEWSLFSQLESVVRRIGFGAMIRAEADSAVDRKAQKLIAIGSMGPVHRQQDQGRRQEAAGRYLFHRHDFR
jgi:hypothetical protein